jgi:hypothetical protein
MPFDPDAYLASKQQPSPSPQPSTPPPQGFDPDAYLKSKGVQPDKSSPERTALDTFANSASMGYLPQLTAAASKLVPDPGKDVDDELRKQGFNLPQYDDSYVKTRDETSKRIAQESKENPKAALAGTIGGAIATAPTMGKALGVPAAGLIGKLGQAAAGGAAQGALQNPGDTEGQVQPAQLGDRAKNAALGGALGIGAQAATSVGSKVLGALTPAALQDFANKLGFAAAGANKSDAKRALAFDDPTDLGGRLKELGGFMLDNGIVKAGDSVENIAAKVGAARDTVGKGLGTIYDTLTKASENPEFIGSLSKNDRAALASTKFRPSAMADEFQQQLEAKYLGTPGGNQAIKQIEPILEDLGNNGKSMNLQEVQKFKAGLDDNINWDSPKVYRNAMVDFRNYLKNKIQDRVSTLDDIMGGSAGMDALKNGNEAYSNLSDLHTIAKNKLAGEYGNNLMSLRDTLLTGVGAGGGFAYGMHKGGPEEALKDAAIGGAAGMGSRYIRKYGPAILSSGANQMAKASSAIGNAVPDVAKGLISAPNPATAGLLGAKVRQ